MATRRVASAKKASSSAQKTEAAAAIAATEAKSPSVEEPRKKPRVRKRLDPNQYVAVRNGFHGILIYTDKTTGESYRWDEFGDEIELTLSTLMRARSAQRRFFEDNWFLIDDPEVIEYLNANQYYKNALSYDGFDDLFALSANEIKSKVEKLSSGQKHGVAYRAKQKIESEELSDLKVIRALEEALGTALIE